MPKTATKHRVVFRAEVDAQTAKKFAAMCDETGVTQIEVTSRLVRWFNAQNSEIQARIIGLMGPHGRKEAAKLYLQQVADDAASTKG